jgi:hypothetical protein
MLKKYKIITFWLLLSLIKYLKDAI